jgi:predicted nucleic acid-binding protein
MGLVVFDSDVLIGFLNRDDAHHTAATGIVREAMTAGTRRLLCAVNLSDILVGPVRVGAHEHVRRMLIQFTIEIVPVDAALAEGAATVRARTGLKLPDAFAVATAIHARNRGEEDVRLASFDGDVLKAYTSGRSRFVE